MSEKVQIVKAKTAGARPKTVGVKTIINDDGAKSRIYTVSSNSPNLVEDLLYAFQKGIDKAREENRKVLGSRSGQ